jgi:hypothetical protein
MVKRTDAKWTAHVYFETKEVVELEVTAPSGAKFPALQKVYQRLKLSGPNDPLIQGIKIQEEGKTKIHTVGMTLKQAVRKTEEQPTAPLVQSLKRYRVRAYPTMHSADMRGMSVSTLNPHEALTAVARTFGIDDIQKLGPYVVEHITPTGNVVVLAKDAQHFKDINQKVVPNNVVALLPAPKPTPHAEQKAFVSKFTGLLSSERKVVKKDFTLKR